MPTILRAANGRILWRNTFVFGYAVLRDRLSVLKIGGTRRTATGYDAESEARTYRHENAGDATDFLAEDPDTEEADTESTGREGQGR
jgi:hypothetical protein